MTEEDSCKNGTYKCEKIDSYKAENKDTENPNKYVMSKSSMNWWSAERFCKALGRRMKRVEELKCGYTIKYSGGDHTWGYCHGSGSTMAWNSSSISEVSSVIKELRKAQNGTETSGNSNYYWLYDAYANTTSSSNSCRAYYVDLTYGIVDYDSRSSGDYALCE